MTKAIHLLLALAGAVFTASSAQAQDVAAGEKRAAMCIGCHGIHGYQSSFPEVHKVPKISGQGAKYIVAALGAYKKGERKHPSMRGIAGSLSEQDMVDLGAYYEQHGASMVKAVADVPAVQPPAAVAELLTRGACASCHGANYSKPIDGAYPKLAGQHADYLFAALRSYATEGRPQIGRANPIMSAQVQPFKRAELKAIADYLGSLPGEVHTVPQSKFR
ncbi:MAG: c-type cytochrome [Rubrivivax sp.]|nr:c-type cytochrome [Rubrivivax sp.]